MTAVYPGATAEDVAEAVAAPIEQQLSSMDGLLYFKSSNGSDGTMNLSIYFDISRDQDLAAVDVQNQVKLAEPQLPEEVRRQGITVKKSQPDILLMIALTSDDPRYDAEYLSNYSKINLEDEIKRIKGVGDAYTFGQLEFSMLLQLDPDRMAQLGLTVADIQNAVREQNTTNPGGRVGREPSPPGTDLTLPVTTKGRLKTTTEFGNIILRTGRDGAVLRMSDVANVQARRAELRPAGPTQRQGERPAPGVPPRRRQCARGEAEDPRPDGRAGRELPARRRLYGVLRHDAVHHRLHRGGDPHPRRGDAAGHAGGVHLPAELAHHADPAPGRAGVDRGDLCRAWRCSASRSTS